MKTIKTCYIGVLSLAALLCGSAYADSTNSAFGVTVVCPKSFSFQQHDGPVKILSLQEKSGGHVSIMIYAKGILPPEQLSQISLRAFNNARSRRKEQADLVEAAVTRRILGDDRSGVQFREAFPHGPLWTEFYTFSQATHIYQVSIQWEGIDGKGLPQKYSMILESMKTSDPQQQPAP